MDSHIKTGDDEWMGDSPVPINVSIRLLWVQLRLHHLDPARMSPESKPSDASRLAAESLLGAGH